MPEPAGVPVEAPARPVRWDLDAAAWRRAVATAGASLPPGLAPPDAGNGAEAEEGAGADADAGEGAGPRADDGADGPGELRSDGESVAAAVLALLGRSGLTVQVTVAAGDRGLRALLGVAGEWGTGLLTVASGGMQVSAFPAVQLGAELERLVPPAAALAGPGGDPWAALDTGPRAPLEGVVPLAALAELPHLHAFGPDAAGRAGELLGLTDQQDRLAARLVAGTRGVLHAVVTGRLPGGADGGAAGVGAVGAAQVVWFGTGEGWIAADPAPGALPVPAVHLHPVGPADLGTTLAPAISRLIEAPPAGGAAAGGGPR